MTDNERDQKLDWRTALPATSLAGGILLILLSLFWPSGATSRANWSAEQAKQYQAASIKLHSLSHASVHPGTDVDPQAQRKELQQAEADYKAIRAELDSAIDRPKHLILAFRVAGVTLVAAGGLGMYYARNPPEA